LGAAPMQKGEVRSGEREAKSTEVLTNGPTGNDEGSREYGREKGKEGVEGHGQEITKDVET